MVFFKETSLMKKKQARDWGDQEDNNDIPL